MSWARYITGWATVEVTGAEPEKLLYALAERGITFWGAAPPKDFTLTVQVPERAVKLIRPLAAAVGCEGRVRSRHGLPAAFRKVRGRYMLLACIGLVAALLYVGSAFIWEIDITGNETVPDGIIRQALSQCGVDIGSYWPAFSQDQIRNSVILRVPDIRWMTVTVRGSHAEVVVREKREHLPLMDRKELVKIVAVKAGLVEEVNALGGTALTEAAKVALPGEELIGGYMTGRMGVLGPTRAIGTVMARTWYELTAKSPLNETIKAADGKKTTRWSLILGKTRINFYIGSSICPSGCDKIIIDHTVGSDGLFALPITLEQTIYTSYDGKQEQTSGLREELETQLMEELKRQVGESGQVVSTEFSGSEKDGAMYVTLRAECREQIGREEPLTEKDLAEIEAKIPKTEEQE